MLSCLLSAGLKAKQTKTRQIGTHQKPDEPEESEPECYSFLGFFCGRNSKNEYRLSDDEKRSQDQGAATNLSGLLYYLVFDE